MEAKALVHNNVVSLGEYKYKKFDYNYNLQGDIRPHRSKKEIRKQMVRGYMELLSNNVK